MTYDKKKSVKMCFVLYNAYNIVTQYTQYIMKNKISANLRVIPSELLLLE